MKGTTRGGLPGESGYPARGAATRSAAAMLSESSTPHPLGCASRPARPVPGGIVRVGLRERCSRGRVAGMRGVGTVTLGVLVLGRRGHHAGGVWHGGSGRGAVGGFFPVVVPARDSGGSLPAGRRCRQVA